RVQEGPAQQKATREQFAFVDAARGCAEREQLPCVIPIVDGVMQVDALVTLKADEPRSGGRGERARDLGLADTGLALEQQRLLERDRQMHRECQRPVREIALGGECSTRLLN